MILSALVSYTKYRVKNRDLRHLEKVWVDKSLELDRLERDFKAHRLGNPVFAWDLVKAKRAEVEAIRQQIRDIEAARPINNKKGC